MRDRLIELLRNKYCKHNKCPDVSCVDCEYIAIFDDNAGKIADIILADGWMRPPCDTAWFIADKNTKYAMAMPRKTNELPLYMLSDLEKYGYYKSREKAEQALKGGDE